MGKHLKIITSKYLESYSSECKVDWSVEFRKLRSMGNVSAVDFEKILITLSLYSSKIEGNTIDVDSFSENLGDKGFYKKEEVEEIGNLVKAYHFASENSLNKTNFLKSHGILSNTFLPKSEQGKLRKRKVNVYDSTTLKPVYLAVEPELVDQEITKLFTDISELLKRDLTCKEVFYYASMIHLWAVLIHPFSDGNGRAARLLEKWFITSKLGRSAWSIHSERYYWENRSVYYENIALGYDFYSVYWDRYILFLLMLPEALKQSVE